MSYKVLIMPRYCIEWNVIEGLRQLPRKDTDQPSEKSLIPLNNTSLSPSSSNNNSTEEQTAYNKLLMILGDASNAFSILNGEYSYAKYCKAWSAEKIAYWQSSCDYQENHNNNLIDKYVIFPNDCHELSYKNWIGYRVDTVLIQLCLPYYLLKTKTVLS